MFLFRIVDNGGIIIERRIESLDELCGEYDVVFNCTGLEAKWLCSDVNVLPIRGQVIRVGKTNILLYVQYYTIDYLYIYIKVIFILPDHKNK